MTFDRFQQWHELYGVAAGIAATLMGLMFVVISLGQRALRTDEGSRVTRALYTPIVVFFVTIIVVSLFMLMPDTGPVALSVLIGATAFAGLGYMLASGAYRFWRGSNLGSDDFIWYVVIPYVSYAALAAAAVMIWMTAPSAAHVEAGAMLLLLLAGIRNAWDLVVYSVQSGARD